ncbi:MAG TPA: co-chaperone GroES family protein, partial [Fibrobacteraceae bacterium]|nr:co-chaperone GroES family protein [Fibrobacteraceae bacterium]
MPSNLKNVVAIGDRVLLRPVTAANQTSGGLYLPPSVKEKDEVHTGIIVKVGPGYPLPINQDFDHFLK